MPDRLTDLRQQIADGSYQVDADAVAEAFLEGRQPGKAPDVPPEKPDRRRKRPPSGAVVAAARHDPLLAAACWVPAAESANHHRPARDWWARAPWELALARHRVHDHPPTESDPLERLAGDIEQKRTGDESKAPPGDHTYDSLLAGARESRAGRASGP
jgi:hypothetical protein